MWQPANPISTAPSAKKSTLKIKASAACLDEFTAVPPNLMKPKRRTPTIGRMSAGLRTTS